VVDEDGQKSLALDDSAILGVLARKDGPMTSCAQIDLLERVEG
jgi:hypothetical protein